MSLRDEIISGMHRSKLQKGMTEIGNETIDKVMNECLNIARNTYIDCAPEEQEIVDMVQQIIAYNIETRFG
jgi:hypothetical protein